MNNAKKKLISFFLILILGWGEFPVYCLDWGNSSILCESSILNGSSIVDDSSIKSKSALFGESSIIEESSLLQKSAIFCVSDGFDNEIIGPYLVNIVNSEKSAIRENVEQKNIVFTERDSVNNETVVGGYNKFLETTLSDSSADFTDYFMSWYNEGAQGDFFEYSHDLAVQKEQLNHLYDAAVKKFGVGTAIVATTWIVSWVVPGGQIVSTALFVVAKSTTIGALSGGLSGAVLSSGIAFAQGKRGDELLYATINGTADGYLIGAVTGLVKGSFSAVKTFSGAIAVENNIYTKAGYVLDKHGKTIGKTIRFAGVDKADDIYYVGKNSISVFDKSGREVGVAVENKIYIKTGRAGRYVLDKHGETIGKTIRFAGVDKADDIYYVGKNSTSVFDKSGREVAKVAKYKDNLVLYRENGRVVGYIKNGEIVSYCDPSSAAIVKGQHRSKPSWNTIKKVREQAVMNGQFNPKTGNYFDAIDGSEIFGTPEMGHIYGHEYTNELQRAYMNGYDETFFRESMNNTDIYQLESVTGNRSHIREALNLTIDSFRNVEKDIGEELWIRL